MDTDSKGNQVLKQIREGMDVYDAKGEQVGTVDFVHFGDPDAVTTESDRGAGEGGGDPDASLFDMLDLDLGADANDRMERLGYIRIDGKGLFSGNRFVSPRGITSVSGNEVRLSVTKDSL